jgi:hypothetical protein
MKHTVILSLLLLFLVSCSNRNSSELYEYQPKQIIDLTNQSDGFDIIERIKSIDVINLTVGDSWVHMRYPRMTISENGYYFLSDRTFFLIGYSKTGELKFSKQIKGRGRGEIMDVGNISMKNDTLMIYDRVLGRMLCYTEEGKFSSFLNRTEVKAEKLYKTDKCFYGLSIFCNHEFDNHYCAMYDNEGSFIDNFLSLPSHYIGYDYNVGYTDMSYLYHDTLRFMLVHDYTLFSLTKNGLESSYRFKSDREMPVDYFDGMTGIEKMNPEVTAKTWAAGFTDYFSELTETDKYLIVNFSSDQQNQIMLYDKRKNTYGLLLSPDMFFEESSIPELTTQDIWKYIMFSSTRLCVYDNSVYGCAPYSLYYILSKTESLHDEKIKTFYDQVKTFVESQKIEAGDMFFFKLDFL